MGTFNSILRVSVAVRDLEASIADYAKLGLKPVSEIKTSPRGFGLRWVELGTDEDGCLLELLSPNGEAGGGPLQRFLDTKGEGLYQLRLGTDDIDTALAEMEGNGVRVIRDANRPEGRRKLGWVHPASSHGVLIEMVEPEEGEKR